jgi:hypothetical protein
MDLQTTPGVTVGHYINTASPLFVDAPILQGVVSDTHHIDIVFFDVHPRTARLRG